MVAELQPIDPLPELAVGSVLKLGDSRSESYIFESSCPPFLLRVIKDKTKTEDQTGVVYRIPCRGCNKVYVVGETITRTVGERIKEQNCQQSLCNS